MIGDENGFTYRMEYGYNKRGQISSANGEF
jgi:hypothetical protein